MGGTAMRTGIRLLCCCREWQRNEKCGGHIGACRARRLHKIYAEPRGRLLLWDLPFRWLGGLRDSRRFRPRP
jgi:hypothetical protein